MKINKGAYLALTLASAIGVGGLFTNGDTFATSVHPAFSDSRFYACVVEAYNNKEAATKNYETDILTDEELSKITSLNCSKNSDTPTIERISETNGLEKLTNLASLNLKNNQIESIDLSENEKLTTLVLNRNQLTSLDISHNPKLQILDLERGHVNGLSSEDPNDVKELDITHNPELSTLIAEDAMIKTNIPLTKNGTVYSMDLSSLKFIANGSTWINNSSDYSYDANNFIVTIPKIDKVSYISIVTQEGEYASNTGQKLAVDKSGLAAETEGEGEGEIQNPDTTASGDEDNQGDQGSQTNEEDKTTDQTPEEKTDKKKTKKNTPSVPDTGIFSADGNFLKFIPFIILPAALVVGFIVSFLKKRAAKKVKF